MFKWRLTDTDLNNDGEVLTKDPRGYENLILKHERGEKWHGITYDFTNEFGFFCKGAGKELVDAAYERKGQEANVLLTLDVKHNGQLTRLFKGKLDFSEYRQEWIAGKLYSFVSVENEDIRSLINVREDLEVDLLRSQSLDGTTLPAYPFAGYGINMHSKVIQLKSSWENEGSLTKCQGFDTETIFEFHAAEWAKVLGELDESNDIAAQFSQSSGGLVTTSIPALVELSDQYEYPFDITVSYNIQGTYFDRAFQSDPTCGSGAASGVSRGTVSTDIFLVLKIGQDFASATRWDLATINDYNVISSVYADNFSTTGSITTSVNRGDKIWLMWAMNYRVLVGVSAFDIQFEWAYSVADISITANTTTPATQATAIAIHEAWSKLASIITDQPEAFYSEFFGRTDSNIIYLSDGCGSKTAITSGLNIRGFSNSAIVTSLKDMFAACNSIWAIGLGIEQYQNQWVIRVEPVYYFYQNTVVLKLVNVPNIKMNHLPDRVYNEISLGFQKWETESTNGLDEPNTRIKYVVPPVKNSKNKFEAISPYVGGMYAIEQTRRKNHLDFGTEDTGYDESIFFICLNKDDLTVAEKNENFSSVTGLLSPETAYNLRLMLSSTFDRIKYLFTSGLTKLGTLANPVLMPSEGEGNENVTYAFVPDGCDGDHFGTTQGNGRAGRYPHAQARRESPLWLPEEYIFEYPISFTQYLALISNPYGEIEFSDGQDNFYSGWLLSLEYNVRNKSGSFRIIRKYG